MEIAARREAIEKLDAGDLDHAIADYTKALLRGNTKQLGRLGNSSAVKQTNANFENVTHSSQATAISNSFHKFGHDISSQFHRIFG